MFTLKSNGSSSFCSVVLAAREHRPDHACVLSRECYGRFVLAPALGQGDCPTAERIVTLWGVAQRGARPVDQQRAQIPIARSGDASQPGLTATGMLLGSQAQPGGKLPPILEELALADARHHRCGRNRPHPRERQQPLRRLALTGPSFCSSRAQ